MEDKKLQEAIEHWEVLSMDRDQMIAYQGRMKRIWDEEAAINEAEMRVKEGLERGIREGIREGLEKGRKEGKKEGQREGKDLREREIVLNMYAENIPIQSIVQLTKIPLEKVKDIIESAMN